MPEGGMHGLWLFPESLEELRSTLEANNKSPLEKCPGTLFGCVVHGRFLGKEWSMLSWEMARRNLNTQWEPQELEGYKYRRQRWMAVVGRGFCEGLRVNLKVPCGRSSKADLKKCMCSVLLLLFLGKQWGKIENQQSFWDNEGDLRERNQVLRETKMLSCDQKTLVKGRQTRGHISLETAFKGPNVISTL